MSSFPRSPRLIKGGLVLLDPDTGAVLRFIVLQYNPDAVSRSFQVQAVGGSEGERSDVMRLKGPPVETFKIDAEIDATDQLEAGRAPATEVGLYPELAALETLLYPPADRLQANHALAAQGTLEIAPIESPLALFVWGRQRVVPVRVTELSVNEEAFDVNLNPIRAKVSLGLRVLSVNDLGFDHRGGALYMAYQRQKERLAGRAAGGGFDALGVAGIP